MNVTKAILFSGVVLAASGREARAESIIGHPGDHPKYSVELEPQLAFGWGHLYAGSGLGVGLRASIPIVDNGFVSTINDSVAISFGLDWLHYSDCFYVDRGGKGVGYGCSASYLVFPVALQWNFWFSPQFSAFVEPGLYVYHGIYDDYCAGFAGCGYPTRTGLDLAFYIGGRLHLSDKVALTLRLGYPTASFGVSIMF